MASLQPMQISIVYASKEALFSEILDLPVGSTVAQAIKRCQFLKENPVEVHDVGIYGRHVAQGVVLKPNDRIEIYRALIIDPKEARRLRCKKD